jgi:hypothetical protein
VITACLVLLAGCSSSPAPRTGGTSSTAGTVHPLTTTTTTAPGTEEVRFDPYAAGGTVGPDEHVTSTVSGTCVAAGVAGDSSYRCFAQGGGIYDPCFAPPGAASGPVLCVADPASPDVVQLDLGALPAPEPGAPTTRAWALQLSDGQVCVLVNAAWGGLGPFACPAPAARGTSEADCHVPTAGSPWWSTECQARQAPSSPFTRSRVVTVWT